jgi:hypothetical protein
MLSPQIIFISFALRLLRHALTFECNGIRPPKRGNVAAWPVKDRAYGLAAASGYGINVLH